MKLSTVALTGLAIVGGLFVVEPVSAQGGGDDGGEACAACLHESAGPSTWRHKFDGEAGVYMVSQGTGFHNQWRAEKCGGETHGHDNSCELTEDQDGDLLAIGEAIRAGDMLTLDVLVRASESVRWSPDGQLLAKRCDGSDLTLSIEWYSASPLFADAPVGAIASETDQQ